MAENKKTEKDGRDKVITFLRKQPLLYAGLLDLNKRPKVYPVTLCYEEEGALYFAAAKNERFYGELSQNPYIVLCACDPESGEMVRLTGEAVFTEEAGIITRCLEENTQLREKWGNQPGMLTAYFIKDMTAEYSTPADPEPEVITLGTPENVLLGIQIKKDTELRDRLIRIMERRGAETPDVSNDEALYLQKLYDGAVLYFAETAKAVWPRMDIGPIERSALFETYDEREQFTGLAKRLIGNQMIRQPEDLTYWLNKETLAGLNRE